MSTPRFSIDNEQVKDSLAVLAWAVVSALVAFGISTLPAVQLPVEWQWLIPVVNAGLYAAKKFLENKNGKLF